MTSSLQCTEVFWGERGEDYHTAQQNVLTFPIKYFCSPSKLISCSSLLCSNIRLSSGITSVFLSC